MLKVIALIFLGLINFNASLHATAISDEMLKDYQALQNKLAYDNLENIQAIAQKLSDTLDAWTKNSATHPLVNHINAMQTATKTFIATTAEAELRIQFGNISRPLVEFIRNSPELHTHWQLFFCPMFPQGYAFWIQAKGEQLLNPYWGKKMLHCGVKKPW